MPKCLECNNTEEFIIAYIEFATLHFSDEILTYEESGDTDRYDETYPPECKKCGSANIEGDL